MAAGIAARAHDASVVLIEGDALGGTCVNVGCVPSKTLLAAAGARHTAATNLFAGAPTGVGEVDLASLVAQKDRLIEGLRQHKYADVADAHGFEIHHGQARFADPATLLVDDQPLRARAYVVAAGAEPARPAIAGIDDVEWLTSTTAMTLDELPASLLVIGGGYVGSEQAQLFAHLGSAVTLVGRPAPGSEPELAAALRQVLLDDGIEVVAERATRVDTRDGQVVAGTASGRCVAAQRLLVATGRTPRTKTLGLTAAADCPR